MIENERQGPNRVFPESLQRELRMVLLCVVPALSTR